MSTEGNAPTTVGGKGRLRSVLAGIVGVVAVVGLLASAIAVWAHDVLFDPSTVSAAVERALDEPEVTAALAERATDSVFAAADVETRVAAIVPQALSSLVPTLVAGAREAVQLELEKTLATEATRAMLVTLVERSHGQLMRLLEGDGLSGGLSVQDGEVTLNLLPLVAIGLRSAQDLGLAPDLVIPTFAVGGDPAVQRAELAAALGRDLPAEFGELVVYRSDALAERGETLAAAQRAVVVIKRSIVLILVVTAVSLIATVLLARRRGRALLVLALASVAMTVLARALIRRVTERAPGLVVDPAGRAAIRATVNTLASGLLTAFALLIVVGLVVAVIAFVRGDHTAAARLRGATGSARGSLSGAVRANREVVGVASCVVAVIVIGVAGLGAASVVIALGFAAFGAWSWWGPGRRDVAAPPS